MDTYIKCDTLLLCDTKNALTFIEVNLKMCAIVSKEIDMLKNFLLFFVVYLLPGIALSKYPTEEYNACYERARDDTEVSLCMKAETQRVLTDIQEVYTNLANHPEIKTWNDGNGLISGNLKEMYNGWLAYREKYCSLFQYASRYTFGSEAFDFERCTLELTLDHYQLVKAAIVNANTGPEEEGHDHGDQD